MPTIVGVAAVLILAAGCSSTPRDPSSGPCLPRHRRPGRLDMDLHLHPGVTGLLGPNGAGKTTLLRALATVLHAERGTARILGRDPANGHQRCQIRRRLGYLPEEIVLSLTVLQVVLGFVTLEEPAIGALHAVNAFLLFWVALHATRLPAEAPAGGRATVEPNAESAARATP